MLNVDLTVNPEQPKSTKRQDAPVERIVMKTPKGRKHFNNTQQSSPIFGGTNEPPTKPIKKEWRPSGILLEYNNKKYCIGTQRMKRSNATTPKSINVQACSTTAENKEALESVKRLIQSKKEMDMKNGRKVDIKRSITPDIMEIGKGKINEYNMNRMNGYMSKISFF